MSKQIQIKTFEASGVMSDAKQNHKKTKRVNEPHTLITIAIPLMDNRKFEEMCLNDGARVCFKIEYIPNKHFLIKDEKGTTKYSNGDTE